VVRRRRRNGHFSTNLELELSRADYEAGRLTWEPSLRLFGYESKRGQIMIVAPSSPKPWTGARFANGLDPTLNNGTANSKGGCQK
jgi:hypothetical protein